MPTRLTWTGGSVLIIVLASASLGWAEPAGTEVGRAPKASSDLSQRIQNSRTARDQNGALAPFLSGPACEVPDNNGSGQHLGWVRTRNQGLIGGSYGEVFFASGAGTSAIATNAVTTGSTSGGSSGSGGGGSTPTTTPGGGSGGSTSPAAGTTSASRGANGDDGGEDTGAGTGGGTHPTAGGPGSGGPIGVGGGDPPAVNPEPTTLILLGTGLTAVLFTERRRRSKK